ncbi:MAG: 4Fe-4S cluster-binding domain-containing protein, partial [Gammaproteobacteria bacterium]|nr:4Fe-4S cluster-binding domain-containing protein [Gammaproteobacteria bacterium]
MDCNWQQKLTNSIKSVDDLVAKIANKDLKSIFSDEAHQQFKIKIPVSFISNQCDIKNDALLKQVLPHANETELTKGYLNDPVGDMDAMVTPGLIHKYQSRALFIVTGACAIHCRYCFRRHFPYGEGPRSIAQWQPAIEQIAADPTIEEVILSGGDPLTLVDAHLAELT